MKTMLLLAATSMLAACGVTTGGEPFDTAESAQTTRLEANDGPFWASVSNGRLTITYREPLSSSFLLCRLFPAQPDVTLLLVVGDRSVSRSMRVSCPRSWGDNGGSTNDATFSITEQDDPALWNDLFPPHADGSRWYALRVAATNAHGQWDSRYGQDYRLVFNAAW
jgi:hypothetical protein